MKTKTRPRKAVRRKRSAERRHEPRLVVGETAESAVAPALAREAELIRDEEDDFADGRSSAGVRTRAEEDAWGRGLMPEERPFEEEDVPPRKARQPRAEPAPETEEPDVEAGG